MANVSANGIQIEYDTFGNRSRRPLLLVMGFGAQMIHGAPSSANNSPTPAISSSGSTIATSGLSSKFDAAGAPDMAAVMSQMLAGEPIEAPYTLDDMADDAFALLDTLDLQRAHVCGASMGGMIVQAMAIRRAQRVLSLTSIMSITGNRELPPAKPEAAARTR